MKTISDLKSLAPKPQSDRAQQGNGSSRRDGDRAAGEAGVGSIPGKQQSGSDSPKPAATPPVPIQPLSERFPVLEEKEIVLTFSAPQARQVTVAGNFNDWDPKTTVLQKNAMGEWAVHLKLRAGHYEYRFVVDGKWQEAPRATQRLANPYGDFNSAFVVPLEDETELL
jgi:hypothetical protein